MVPAVRRRKNKVCNARHQVLRAFASTMGAVSAASNAAAAAHAAAASAAAAEQRAHPATPSAVAALADAALDLNPDAAALAVERALLMAHMELPGAAAAAEAVRTRLEALHARTGETEVASLLRKLGPARGRAKGRRKQ